MKIDDVVCIPREEFKKFIKDVHDTMVELLPGVKYIALQRYDRLNDVMVQIEQLHRKLERDASGEADRLSTG